MKSKVLSVWVVALVICCVCGVSQAGISYDNASSAFSDADNTTLSWSHTVGAGDNRILVVGIAAEDPSPSDLTVSSVMYGGASMTLAGGSTVTVGSSTLMQTELYFLVAPPVGTDTVTVTYAGNVSNRNAGAVSLRGAAQQGPESAAINSHTALDSITTRINTLSDGSWLVDVVGCGDSGHFSTIAGSMSERWDVGFGISSDSSAASSTKPVATARLTTMSWQHGLFSPSRLAHSVASFAPAEAAEPNYGSGDLNGDTIVDWQDANMFFEQWLDASCSGSDCADLDGMNGVNFTDYAILAANWTWVGSATGLVINEFMASNSNVIADGQGDYDDWIEVYNGTDSPIDIGGMYITDDLNEPNKWQIPDDAPGQTIIPAYGYLLLWADGETAQGKLHLPFQLSKSGEDVGLFESDLTPVDGTSYGEQVGNISFGRDPNNNDDWIYMGIPTPRAENSAGYAGLVDEPEISHVHGFYDSPFEVELYCDDDEAEIRYTTNGDTPTESTGTIYNPLAPDPYIDITTTTCLRAAAFKFGWKGSTVNTATYIFLDDVKTQDDSDAYARGFPAVWQDKWGSTNSYADYEMDNDDVLNIPAYSNGFTDAMKAIPTVLLVTDVAHLFSPETGIYSNPLSRHDPENGENWERPVSVEYFDPCTGEDFQINAGLRVVGNQSLEPWLNSKHSLRVFFKGEFGPSELEFPLYPNTGASRLNNLSLRANYHWSWLDGGNASRAQYLRDTFAQDTFREMDYLSPDSRHVHVYINGLYWGLYQASERPDDAFLAEHLGGEREEYDIIEGVIIARMDEPEGDPDALGGIELKAGEQDGWDYMWSLFDGNDFSRPISEGNYEELEDYLDMPAFCDYIIYNAFVENWDWCAKNWYAGGTRGALGEAPASKWMFYTWDAEISMFQHEFHKTVPFTTYYSWGPGNMHNCLHGNADYNRLLGDRIHKLLFNEGVLTEQPDIDRYNARAVQIEDAVIGESARWGDFLQDSVGGNPVYTPADWDTELDRMTNPARTWDWWGPYFPRRTDDAIGKFEGDGSYPGVDAPSFSQQGGEISAGSSVTISGGGTIYHTTDGSEPMDYGTTGSSVPISHSLTLKARADYGGGNWSALNEATFAVGDLVGDLRITEIMYRPAEVGYPDGPDDPNEEFIELKNIGSGTINLNLVKLTEGVQFSFGDMTLSAGQHVLVVKNITAFDAEYGGGLNIAGEWTGPRGGVLSNAGERIRLEDAIGRTILDFSYNDGWRKVTDGGGFSLNIVDESADANLWGDKANWAASKYKGGTPGSDDSGLLAEHSIAINEVLAHTDVAPQDWIELKNTTSGSIDISGWYLSDSDENLLKYQIASGTSIGPDGYLVLTENDNFGPNSVDPGMTSGFRLSEHGETVYLTSSDGSVLTGYREQEDFGASENGVSFGRHLKSTLTYNFVAMSSTSFGSDNNPAKVGPIVINEIMYNPASGGQNEEYIELHNITGSVVNLYEVIDTNVVGWKFTDGIKYTFGAASIPANGYMLVVKTDPVYFKTLYSVPGGITVLGPYEGRLGNGGEKLELSKPGDIDDQGQQTYIRVDRVAYSDGVHPDNPWETDPWPKSPDAGGDSLNRKVGSDYGNDIANWEAAAPSPGAANY